MNPNALAEVYVGKQDGNGEKKYDGFATGYPIAQDRVITAGHVLSGDYNFIEVRFRNSKENAGLIPAMREWPGSAKFDVAVLSCTIPKDVPGNPSLLADHDSSSTKGRVLGYPRVDDTHNKPGDARKLCDSTGELGALESIASHFEFRVNYDFRKQGEGWKGLSGAGVPRVQDRGNRSGISRICDGREIPRGCHVSAAGGPVVPGRHRVVGWSRRGRSATYP